jgi:selenide,water dikinase
MAITSFRLSMLSPDGGWGRKLLAKEHLGDVTSQPFRLFNKISSDSTAVHFDDRIRLIASTNFITPLVDDPRDFGQIAAASALSNIYASGGEPLVAFAIVGMPLDELSEEVSGDVLAGGASVCAEAGVSMVMGDVTDVQTPIFGLTVIGRDARVRLHPPPAARSGDALILTKSIGVGIYASALKRGVLSLHAYEELMSSAKLLNRVGTCLAEDDDVHAVVEVAGHGLLGHCLKMAQKSGVSLNLRRHRVPIFRHAAALARSGFVAELSRKNWEDYGSDVVLPVGLSAPDVHLLTDPQTSGGLLISCSQSHAGTLRDTIVMAGYPNAEIIGSVSAGPPCVKVS